MANEREPSADAPNFSIPWLWRWWEADFSWSGLLTHAAWPRGQSGSLQDYVRRLDRDQPDEQLISQGALIECGIGGLFHVLFVPDEWADSVATISSSELLRLKQFYWNKLMESGGIREHFRGSITGVHLPQEIEERLVSSFATSFEWVRFNHPLRSIPRRGDRSFTRCAFNDEVIFFGPVNSEAGSHTVHFTWCDFEKKITAEQVSGLDLLDINGSRLGETFQINDSELNKLRLDYCSAKSVDMTDTIVKGPLTVGGTTVDRVEWINCTFEGHVLFVEAAIQKSLGWLACDFKSRVTLASMTWPSSPFGCASASGSKFDGIVEIDGGDPPPFQLFQEAEFRSRVALSSFSDRAKRQSFEKELLAAQSNSDPLFNKQEHAQKVESGCRTLRKVAEAAGDVHGEHLWHRFELIARKTRGESAASEKGFSYLYGLLADYGLSIGRPFAVLAISTLFFGFLYSWLGGSKWFGALDVRSLAEGFGYSLNRTLPIGVFGDDDNAWRKALLGGGGEIGRIAVRILATAQTVLSAVLIYLGIMAIRRKFRIS